MIRCIAIVGDPRVTQVQIDRETLVDLRSDPKSFWHRTLDITPQPMAIAVHAALAEWE
jgi:hypothetical protein